MMTRMQRTSCECAGPIIPNRMWNRLFAMEDPKIHHPGRDDVADGEHNGVMRLQRMGLGAGAAGGSYMSSSAALPLGESMQGSGAPGGKNDEAQRQEPGKPLTGSCRPRQLIAGFRCLCLTSPEPLFLLRREGFPHLRHPLEAVV